MTVANTANIYCHLSYYMTVAVTVTVYGHKLRHNSSQHHHYSSYNMTVFVTVTLCCHLGLITGLSKSEKWPYY